MVYGSIKAGKNVNWIIRKTGERPAIFMNPATSGRYRNNAEAGATQKATMLNPSGFRPMPEWARTLHQSPSERENLESKLLAADRRYKAWANYRGREGALPGFCELEPSASFFWLNGPIGMIQHDDFWDLISQKVNIYRAEISDTSANSIILDDGRQVPTDILLCGTGWIADYPFISPDQAIHLGLPHDSAKDSEEERRSWNDLTDAADRQITTQFPILARPPPPSTTIDRNPLDNNNSNTTTTTLTPARLYQGIAPISSPTILFLSRARLSNNFRLAEAQAIWATAYWDGHVSIPPIELARRHVAYTNAFSRRRYPSRYRGSDGVNFHADLIWYTDALVCEAGLRSHRQRRGGWFEDPEAPCLVSDFRDCRDEYRAMYVR